MSLRLLFLLSFAVSAQAATITVTTSADSGPGSLRQAILQANSNPDADVIQFNLATSDPGFQAASAHWRIDVSSALPMVSEALTIDGYSQPGANTNTQTPAQGGSNAVLKIELRNATGDNNAVGISSNFSGQAMVIRGLVINQFARQITLSGTVAQVVEGCFLGTTSDGTGQASTSNTNRTGIAVFGTGAHRIGGLSPDQRNVISGDATGIRFSSSPSGVRIEGNLIGTNAAGTAAISPRATGISAGLFANLRIGGTDPNARNLISGNGFNGLRIDAGTDSSARIEGNFFGTDWSGTRAIPNGLNPFSPSQPQANIVVFPGLSCPFTLGGVLPGQANLIAFSPRSAIAVSQCSGALAQYNRFYGNQLALDDSAIGGDGDGTTANDLGDPDTGGNRLQNYPELSVVSTTANSVNLNYRVDSLPANSAYPITVEFFRAGCGGGAQTRIGSDVYTLVQAGTVKSFSLTPSDGGGVFPLTAVAVDTQNNVSEFAPSLGELILQSGFEDGSNPVSAGSCQ